MKIELENLMSAFRTGLIERFSLAADMGTYEEIDQQIKSSIELKGANAVTLILAIFIASVGLNVNSSAVIIGAMLVSPLMGPISGVGYGVAVYDFFLIRKSLLNLAVATGVSLITSTVYFSITPLTGEQSELLARTSPSVWDVVIAILGGFAGAIGSTRKEKSNVVPGVAIATALMPPLCTAGFGIASGNFEFFGGALYLFFINSVFIAVAYAVVINLLRVPHKTFVDKFVEQRVRRTLFAIVAITALPSLYLAYHLVRGEIFKNAARDFVQKEIRSSFVQVAKLDVDPKSKRIDVTLIGRALKRDDIDRIHDRLAQSKVAGSDLKLYQNGDLEFDVSALKNEIVQNLQINSLQLIQERDRRISELETELRKLNAESTENERFIRELTVQYPTLRNVSVGSALTLSNGPSGSLRSQNRLLVLGSSQRLSKDDRIRLSNWFRVRMEDQNAKVVFEE
jgi:uncharacterized hydrophobic protein (TIGR00271 family)